MCRKAVPVSAPWQPLQVLRENFWRASLLVMPSAAQKSMSFSALPARKGAPSSVAGALTGGGSPIPQGDAQPASLLTSPLFHVGGLHSGVCTALSAGAKLVFSEGRFDPEQVMKLIQETRGGRDYTANFGERQRGDGPYADLIAQRFRMAVKRLGYNEKRNPVRCDLFRPPPKDDRQGSLF